MLIDLSVAVTEDVRNQALDRGKSHAFGHLGTHFDVMDKEFPLAFTRREGIVFTVEKPEREEIDLEDIDLEAIRPDTFVALRSGFIDRFPYGSEAYFHGHPQVANRLIDALLDRNISLIGIDFPGIRRGAEHAAKDQHCADRGVFIVENLCGLDRILAGQAMRRCVIHTYPVRFAGMTGLPCRVVAELDPAG